MSFNNPTKPFLLFPTQYALINESNVLDDGDLTKMSLAINIALADFCSDWSTTPSQTIAVKKGGSIPPQPAGMPPPILVTLSDVADIPGSYGTHGIVNNVPYAKVFVKPILDNGGVVLYSPTNSFSVSRVTSYHIFGLIGQIAYPSWWNNLQGTVVYGWDLCNPVQGNSIPLKVTNYTVGISDYILPNWANPSSTTRPFNKLDTLTAPLSVDSTGYCITLQNGVVTVVAGSSLDPSIKETVIRQLQADPRFSSMTINTS